MPTFSNTWFTEHVQPIWERHLLPRFEQKHRRDNFDCPLNDYETYAHPATRGGLPCRCGISRPLTYVEIGVFEGQSLCWMLDNVLTHNDSRAIGVDPFIAVRRRAQHEMAAIRAAAIANLSHPQYRDRVTLVELTSREFLLSGVLGRASVDILYIDGDHNAPAVLQDTVLGWPFVREGGLLIFDDYHLEADHQRKYPGVREAVDGLLASFRGRYELAWMTGRQVAVKKTRGF